jgi:hypothetical protein
VENSTTQRPGHGRVREHLFCCKLGNGPEHEKAPQRRGRAPIS